MPVDSEKLNTSVQYAVEIAIRLGFLFVLLAWCLQILYPFVSVVIWAVILAMASAPLFDVLRRRLGDKPKLAAVLLSLFGLAIILLPAWLFLDSVVDGARALEANLEAGTLRIPPPHPEVAEWPVVGPKLYALWSEASANLGDFTVRYQDQIERVARQLLQGMASVGGSIILFLLATVIAGVLLATEGTGRLAQRFFHKVAGTSGDDFADITARTVRNVVKGVIGVALIQALLIGLGFLLAGVPYAGAWTLLIFVMGILQLPVMLVVLFVIIWLFSALSPLAAVLWTLYLLLAGLSDNFLKPILLGKGAPVPTLVIFLGVIGGFLVSGFIGLFTGAIILSLGYRLFISWLNSGEELPAPKPASR